MKKLLFILSILTITSQAQDGFNFQGAAVDANGDELQNQSISIKTSVLSDSVSGTIQWQEIHSTTTDQFGLFNVVIGQGSSTGVGLTTNFDNINWGSGNHYLRIEMDATGGSNYTLFGTSQLMSVPYALYAKSAGIDSTMLANMIGSSVGGMGGGCDFRFPEGLDGDFISVNLKQGDFTIPSDKNFYIINTHNNNSYSVINLDALNFLEISHGFQNGPVIAGGGSVLSWDNGGGSATETNLFGFLLDKSLDIVSINLKQGDYSVPVGKNFHIINAYSNSSYDVINLDGLNFLEISQSFQYVSGAIAGSGSVLSWDNGGGSATQVNLFGYLVDEDYFAGCGGGGNSSSASAVDSAMVAGMIANVGGGNLVFGEIEDITLTFENDTNTSYIYSSDIQAKEDGFLFYNFNNRNSLYPITLLHDSLPHVNPIVGTEWAHHDIYDVGGRGAELVPIKKDYYWSIKMISDWNSIQPGIVTNVKWIPLKSASSGSTSVSNSIIDSLSQKISKLDSTLFSLISRFTFGCTDPLACNYNPNSDLDDGSCYGVLGCMDSTAKNFNSAATCDSSNLCEQYGIGDFYKGGIIFYLDGNGGGLVAATSDLAYSKWGCSGTGINTSDSIGSGLQNTANIFNSPCLAGGDAADICYRLNNGGYNDWFLPSKYELNLMYNNLHTSGLGNFLPNSSYWSSTEHNMNSAWTVDMSNGSYIVTVKSHQRDVRPIRAF